MIGHNCSVMRLLRVACSFRNGSLALFVFSLFVELVGSVHLGLGDLGSERGFVVRTSRGFQFLFKLIYGRFFGRMRKARGEYHGQTTIKKAPFIFSWAQSLSTCVVLAIPDQDTSHLLLGGRGGNWRKLA